MGAEIRQAYFKYGWLIPAVLPLAQVTGRAVFTILGIVFLMWAGASLYGQRITLDRTVVSRYGVLLVAFLLSVPDATDSVQALSEWSRYLVYTSVFLIIALTLSTNSEGAPQLIKAFGLCGLALLALLYLLLIVDVQRPGFKPTLSMHEDNLPFLTPFMLYLINESLPLKHRKWTALTAGFLITAYVVLSEGRAALAGLVVALMSYAILVLGWRTISAFVLAMIALIVTVGDERFTRGAAVGQSFTQMMDSFTSERTELWRNALNNPPRNPFFGVGIGNGSREQATLSVTVIRKHGTKIVRLKHLHNFLLDAWYETGLFGLGALLFWLVEVLRRGLLAWREHKPPYSAQAGVFLAAALGIMSNAMFSYSYTSKQFAGYLFVFFAALVHLRALVVFKVAA